MNFKSLLFSVLATTLMLTGCQKENAEEGKASMELNPTELNFDATSSSQTVQVTCNRKWKVKETDIPEWLALTINGVDIRGVAQNASSSPVTVTVTVLENKGFARPANILFDGGTLAKKTLKVKQAGMDSYTTIQEVREMLAGLKSDETVTVAANTVIKGYIVSGSGKAELNNLASVKSLYVQDETAGLNVFCSAEPSVKFGDEVTMDLSGTTLKLYGGSPEIDGLGTEKIITFTRGNIIAPREVTINEFLSNKYDGMYIAIKDSVQVAEGDLSKTWVADKANTNINMVTKSGVTFVVRSCKSATYGSKQVAQGSGLIKGISTQYNGGFQLVFAQASDYDDLTHERFEIEVPKVETELVSDVVAASQGAEITLKNVTVIAACITTPNDPLGKDTFMVEDKEGGRLLIFDAPLGTIGAGTIKIGDKVTVKGSLTSYSGTPQLAEPEVTKTSSGSYTYPEKAKDISDELDTYAGAPGEYVCFTGTLDASVDDYFNVKVEDATKVIGAFLQPKFIENIEDFKGVPNVTYTGYYLYHNNQGKYLYIILTDVKASTAPYLQVYPAEINVKSNETSAKFDIKSNMSVWTCTPSEGASVDWTAGGFNQTVTITFPENKDYENTKTYIATVTAGEFVKTVTVVQSKADNPNVRTAELTNAEIKAAIAAEYVAAGKAGYPAADFAIESASGDWVANANLTSEPKYLQMRNSNKSHILSPKFGGNISKIELVINEKTVKRNFYALPASTGLTNENYGESIFETAYGSAACEKSKTQTITIEFTGDTNQFNLIVGGGAGYIDSIKVYYTPTM